MSKQREGLGKWLYSEFIYIRKGTKTYVHKKKDHEGRKKSYCPREKQRGKKGKGHGKKKGREKKEGAEREQQGPKESEELVRIHCHEQCDRVQMSSKDWSQFCGVIHRAFHPPSNPKHVQCMHHGVKARLS